MLCVPRILDVSNPNIIELIYKGQRRQTGSFFYLGYNETLLISDNREIRRGKNFFFYFNPTAIRILSEPAVLHDQIIQTVVSQALDGLLRGEISANFTEFPVRIWSVDGVIVGGNLHPVIQRTVHRFVVFCTSLQKGNRIPFRLLGQPCVNCPRVQR